MFCDAVYRQLGYYGRRASSESSLLQDGASCGIDLAPHLVEWGKAGCYCYTANHPKLRVISTYARTALEVAGIPAAPVSPELMLPDRLANTGTWPVYPEIAAEFGIEGDLDFYPPHHGSGAKRPTLPLREFIERSFAMYGRVEPQRVTIPRSAHDEARFAELRALSVWPSRATHS